MPARELWTKEQVLAFIRDSGRTGTQATAERWLREHGVKPERFYDARVVRNAVALADKTWSQKQAYLEKRGKDNGEDDG